MLRREIELSDGSGHAETLDGVIDGNDALLLRVQVSTLGERKLEGGFADIAVVTERLGFKEVRRGLKELSADQNANSKSDAVVVDHGLGGAANVLPEGSHHDGSVGTSTIEHVLLARYVSVVHERVVLFEC